MFLQVFTGRVTDPAQVREALTDWLERLAPGAEGWLGSTTGVTDDGLLVGVARFTDREAAMRNSGRALQGEWWSATSKLFAGEVAFADCSETFEMRGGGSDDAGFVQVMQGRTADVGRMREVAGLFDDRFPELRPDLIGCVVGVHDGEDGRFTQVAYFRTEAEARAGERAEPPPEAAEMLREDMALTSDVVWYDLREPWLHSPT